MTGGVTMTGGSLAVQVRSIAEKVGPQGVTLIVNPQWSTKGQVIHDFGFLPWQRKASEEVVTSFTEVGSCIFALCLPLRWW